MYEQDEVPERATKAYGNPSAVKPSPVRDELARALGRLTEELAELEAALHPVLAHNVPQTSERESSPHPYMSEIGGQVAQLHDLANSIGALTRRVEI